MKIVCVGHTTYDITLPTTTYPIENNKYRIDKKIECGGGPASNAAYLLSKWGEEVSFVGVVGNDYYGQSIIKEFNHIGVNTEYIEKNSSTSTDSSYIISNLENGSRTIITSKSKQIPMLSNPIDITDANYILIDGEHHETAREVIFRNPKAISIIDAGRCTKEVANLCSIVNYIVCSKDFAESFTNIKVDYNNLNSLVNIYETLKSRYNKQTIVITLESKGSFTKIGDKYMLIPSISVKAIDSTGAGDIFHGAFLYFLIHNYSLEDVIRLSSITAALSVTKIGARYAIPEKDEVIGIYSKNEVI